MKHTTPQITTLGIGYMIAPGGGSGSNTDPYAMAATPDNQWGVHQPHVMIAVPDTEVARRHLDRSRTTAVRT